MDAIPHIVTLAFRALGEPRTQEAFCDIAALVAVSVEDREWTDGLILETAASMAKGIFGPAFVRADYGSRAAWIDMCERALRKSIS